MGRPRNRTYSCQNWVQQNVKREENRIAPKNQAAEKPHPLASCVMLFGNTPVDFNQLDFQTFNLYKPKKLLFPFYWTTSARNYYFFPILGLSAALFPTSPMRQPKSAPFFCPSAAECGRVAEKPQSKQRLGKCTVPSSLIWSTHYICFQSIYQYSVLQLIFQYQQWSVLNQTFEESTLAQLITQLQLGSSQTTYKNGLGCCWAYLDSCPGGFLQPCDY